MPVKTFRGKISSGIDGQTKINLHTNDGKTGYRVTKFHVMPLKFLGNSNEAQVLLWRREQTSVSSTDVDFSDQTLLAASLWSNNATNDNYPEDNTIIVDNKVINQDLYITSVESSGRDMNYYIELETTKLDLTEQSVATLQSIRSSRQGTGQKA